METYQNPGETSEAIMDKVYRSWIFKWYRNPKALVAWMKTTFWRVSDSDRDRENYEMVFGQDTRPLLEKFIDYLKTTDGREPVELGECVLETLLRRRTVRIANIYFLCWLFVIRLSIDTDWLRLIQKLKPHQIRKRNGTLRVEMRHYTTAPPLQGSTGREKVSEVKKAKANALKRSSSSSDSEVDASVPEKVSPEEIVKSEPSEDSTPTDSDSDSEVEIKYYLNILSLSLPYHFRHPHLLSHYTL